MNVIDLKVIEELSAIVETIATDAAIKGAVITSGKETFCVGADLTMLEHYSRKYRRVGKGARRGRRRCAAVRGEPQAIAALPAHRDLRQAVGRGDQRHRARRRLRALPGLPSPRRRRKRENARRASRGQGRPLPGAGGTQRIARMMPPGDALQFLLKGDQLRLPQAMAMKLIDAVVPAADLVPHAKTWIKTRIKAGGETKAPWDAEGFRLPGGPVYSKAGMMTFPGRQRDLSARDLRQLSGRARHHAGRLRGSAAADGRSACASNRAGSQKSCARRKRPP